MDGGDCDARPSGSTIVSFCFRNTEQQAGMGTKVGGGGCAGRTKKGMKRGDGCKEKIGRRKLRQVPGGHAGDGEVGVEGSRRMDVEDPC